MTSARLKDSPPVPVMVTEVWDETIVLQVVTCDPGAVLMATVAEGAKLWITRARHPDSEVVVVKVDQDLWELTCALPGPDCPWCGTPLNEAGQHLNAVIGSACERVHPRPAQDGEDQ